MPKRTPERIAEAVALKAAGKTVAEIAKWFGCSWHTAHTLSDPAAYAVHKERAMTWQARNPDKAAASRKRYHQRPEVAEARNAALRIRYATDQDYRAARDGWSSTYRQGLQPRLATALRTMTWALAVGRRPMPYPRVAETCFGLPLSQMEARLAADGSTDHVIPLSAFDLSDSVQIRKATHWTNVQRIPLLENCAKAYKVPEGLNLSLLPYVDTPEAKAAADAMIARASRKR